jgi:hypothetical protein
VVTNANHKIATRGALLNILRDKDYNFPKDFLKYFDFVTYNNQEFLGIDPIRVFWDHYTLESI